MPSASSSDLFRPSIRSLSALTFLLLSLTPSSHAQVGTILDKSKLPSCAFQCQTLLNAQTVCVPPAAPTTDQATYQGCFCNSAYLVQFKQSPIDICGGACTAADLQNIQTWFNGLCTSGAVVTPAGGTTTSTTTTPGSTATSSSSSSSQNSSKNSGHSNQTWISTHYRWIIMLIILIIAGIAAIFLGLWLKRRKRTQRELRHRDSTLGVEDAVASMRSRHPDTGSMTQLPGWERGSLAMSSREMIAGTPPPRAASGVYGGTPTSEHHGKGRGRGEVVEAQAMPDMHGATGDENRNPVTKPIRSVSKRLAKKASKKGRN